LCSPFDESSDKKAMITIITFLVNYDQYNFDAVQLVTINSHASHAMLLPFMTLEITP
jgi:hypothetical protein